MTAPRLLLTLAVATLCAASMVRSASAQEERGVPAESRIEVSLDQAIRLALERNPVAIAARSELDVAGADVLEARGAWLPAINANSSFTNSSNQRFDQATGRLVSESYTAQLQASYDLFTGGRRLAERNRAVAGLRAAEAQSRNQRFETILETSRLFYEAAAAAEIVAAGEQRLDRARRQLEFADTRLRLGTATRSDALRAELELANAEVVLLDAETALRSSWLNLGRQIGEPAGAEPRAYALPDTAPAMAPVAALIAWALARSPAVLSSSAELEQARATRWTSYGAYLPSLRATAGYDWFAFDFPPDDQSWSLRLTASIPLFDNFAREADLARASAAERLAEAEARDAAIAVRVAVENAAREIEAAERRAEIARRALALAREDLRVQEERYRIGSSTILDLQTSQVALAEAEIDRVRARQNLGVAVANLEAVLGATLAEVGR